MATGSTARKSSGRTTAAKPKASDTRKTYDRLKSRRGIVRRLPVTLDSEVAEELVAAERAYKELEANDLLRQRMTKDEQDAIVDRYAAAKAAHADNIVTIVLRRPIVHVSATDDDVTTMDPEPGGRTLKGRQAYEYLLEHHPATDEQHAEMKEAHGDDAEAPYNSETFTPALVSACAEDPVMTPDEVDDLISEWSFAEVMSLFAAAMEVSTGTSIDVQGKGFGGMSA